MAGIDYGAMNAKVGNMKGNLLEYNDFYLLCNFSKVYDMQIKLKQYSAYSTIEVSENFSKDIKIDFADDFCKIINFINDYNIKKYLRTVLFLFEADLIKKIVYFKFNEQDFILTDRESAFLSEIEPRLNIAELLETNNLKDLMNVLQDSKFYPVLKEVHDKDRACVWYGIALERYCFQQIEKAKKSNLSKEDAKAVSKINGTNFDMQNLIRMMKYKKYGRTNINAKDGLSDADIPVYSFLHPYHYRLKSEDIKKLNYCKSFDEFNHCAETIYYRKYLNQPPDMAYFSAMNDVFKKLPGKNNISHTLYYLFKKYYEVKNLCMIFEGIKYNMPHQKILELLYIS